MPILVKDYTWIQSSMKVNIRIPLEPVYREKVDLFTSDSYIKAHFRPFLFEVFLLHNVDIKKSKCIVDNDAILLDLVKKEDIEWTSLEKTLSKDEKKTIRQEILEECQNKAKQEAEEKVVKKSHLDRFTVQRAMDIDSKQHDLMDSRKNEQIKKAMDELENWRTTIDDNHTPIPHQIIDNHTPILRQNQNYTLFPRKNKTSGVKIVELPSSEDEDIPKNTSVTNNCTQSRNFNKTGKSLVKSEYIEKKKKETAKRILPKVRQTSVLEVTHTPRSFPTPSRESTAQEEEAWLKNITLARRATGFVSEDLRPEEQDPQWCKEKGDEFFRSGNFLGAVSAYTHGITLSDKLPTLFANRAATHFALGNFNKCANDCSTALDLMKPACEGNRKSRAKCIARRGAALVRLGYLNKGIDEMKAAAKLLPDDETIKKDIYDMERAWEQNPDSE